MRKMRISVLACLLALTMASAFQLSGCTSPAQSSDQGMIGGRGPDYEH